MNNHEPFVRKMHVIAIVNRFNNKLVNWLDLVVAEYLYIFKANIFVMRTWQISMTDFKPAFLHCKVYAQ